MLIRLLYFGVLQDLLGGRGGEIELAEGTDVAGMVRVLRGDASNQRIEERVWGSLAVAVNREYAGGGRVLEDGDEVALLPPVSGGRR